MITYKKFTHILLGVALICGASTPALAQHGKHKKVDDATLTSMVKDKIDKDKDLSNLKLNVTAKKGVIILTGNAKRDAENKKEMKKAVKLAKSVHGVKRVKADLKDTSITTTTTTTKETKKTA